MFTKPSYKILDRTFKEVDIYQINNFPYQLAAHDVGASRYNLIEEIRTKWLYSSTGFYNEINKQNQFLKRINEFILNLDYPKSLRQRINIVHEMMKTDFNSLVPIHISVALKKDEDVILDANDYTSGFNFSFIAHPGQTRAQASVFCKRNLNNVLFYISKKEAKKIKLKNFTNIKKIETYEELHKVYSPLDKEKNKNYTVDLCFGRNDRDITKDQKIHRHLNIEIPILKAVFIKTPTLYKDEKGLNYHPGTKYVFNSFISFDKFCKVFHNNQYKIFSHKREPFITRLFSKLDRQLIEISIQNNLLPSKKVLDLLDVDERTQIPKSTILRTIKDAYEDEEMKLWLDKYDNFFAESISLIEDKIEYHSVRHLPLVQVEKDIKLQKIVEKNQYRGYALYLGNIDYDKLIRTPIEFLFFISGDNTVTISEDKQIAVINCEHEYWKTGANYKEWRLTKEMYSE